MKSNQFCTFLNEQKCTFLYWHLYKAEEAAKKLYDYTEKCLGEAKAAIEKANQFFAL